MFLKRIRHSSKSLKPARSSWDATKSEKRSLKLHDHVEAFGRIDQMWPWLKSNYGNVLALEAPHAFHPERYSYAELSDVINTAAASFSSFGISRGEVVAVFSENSPRWLVADQGIMRIDAIDAVRGASAPIEELKYILEDSQSIALVIQTAELFHELQLSEDQRSKFKLILQLEGQPAEGAISWDSFLSQGLEFLNKSPELKRGLDSADSTIATILYTSGTTGKPKGVPLSHKNLLHQMRSLACIANPPPGSAVLSVLPIWHSYERSAEYYFFSCACTQTYTTIKKLKHDLPRVRPIVMATVPRLWEAIQAGFYEALKEMPAIKKCLLKTALKNSGAYKLALRKSRNLLITNVGYIQRMVSCSEVVYRFPAHLISDFFLWPQVLKKLCGGRLRFPISGGGAIAPHVDLFFESLGIELLVGYGLTETSPVVSCRRPWRNIRGSAGFPLPETFFCIVDPISKSLKKINERGLVMVKGPQVMNGYLNKQEATAKVLNDEGWFDTGDLGLLMKDGSLVLTGRFKDTIVLNNGENIEPAPLEEALIASSLIEQVLIVGQDEKQLGALVVPNIEAIQMWSKSFGLTVEENLGGISGNIALRKLLKSKINDLLKSRQGSRRDERVFGVAFVDPFTIKNGLLTQTLKQRRDKIIERDHQVIDEIYQR